MRINGDLTQSTNGSFDSLFPHGGELSVLGTEHPRLYSG